MPGLSGPGQNGFQSKLGLPFRCAAQHKTVAVLEGEQLTDRLNLIGRDAVGWKFVGVEDALDAGQLGGTCKFPAQPGKLSTVLVQCLCSKTSKHALEREGQNNGSVRQSVGNHARFCFGEHGRCVVQ